MYNLILQTSKKKKQKKNISLLYTYLLIPKKQLFVAVWTPLLKPKERVNK